MKTEAMVEQDKRISSAVKNCFRWMNTVNMFHGHLTLTEWMKVFSIVNSELLRQSLKYSRRHK